MGITSSLTPGINAINGLFDLEKEEFYLGNHKTFNEQCLRYLLRDLRAVYNDIDKYIIKRILLDPENGVHENTKNKIANLIKKSKCNTNIHYIDIRECEAGNEDDKPSRDVCCSDLPILSTLKLVSENPETLILNDDFINDHSLVSRSLILMERWTDNDKLNIRIHMIRFDEKNKLKFMVTANPDKGSDVIIHRISKSKKSKIDDIIKETYTSNLDFRLGENLGAIKRTNMYADFLTKSRDFRSQKGEVSHTFENIIGLTKSEVDSCIKVNVGNPSQYRSVEMKIAKESNSSDSEMNVGIKIPYVDEEIEGTFKTLDGLDEFTSRSKSTTTKMPLSRIVSHFKTKYNEENYNNDIESYKIKVTNFKEMGVSKIKLKSSVPSHACSEPTVTRSNIKLEIILSAFDADMDLVFSDTIKITDKGIKGTESVHCKQLCNYIIKNYTLEAHPTEPHTYMSIYTDLYAATVYCNSLYIDYETNELVYEEKLNTDYDNINRVKITTTANIRIPSTLSNKVSCFVYNANMVSSIYSDIIEQIIADKDNSPFTEVEFS